MARSRPSKPNAVAPTIVVHINRVSLAETFVHHSSTMVADTISGLSSALIPHGLSTNHTHKVLIAHANTHKAPHKVIVLSKTAKVRKAASILKRAPSAKVNSLPQLG